MGSDTTQWPSTASHMFMLTFREESRRGEKISEFVNKHQCLDKNIFPLYRYQEARFLSKLQHTKNGYKLLTEPLCIKNKCPMPDSNSEEDYGKHDAVVARKDCVAKKQRTIKGSDEHTTAASRVGRTETIS